MTEQDTSTRVVTLSPEARTTITHMREQADAAAEFWKHRGRGLDDIITMQSSLTRALTTVLDFQMGTETRVSRDGDLSLYVIAGIHMGVIFFPKGRPDAPLDTDQRVTRGAPRLGRYCGFMIPSKAEWCLEPITRGEPGCGTSHPGADVFALPVLGEWSLHS